MNGREYAMCRDLHLSGRGQQGLYRQAAKRPFPEGDTPVMLSGENLFWQSDYPS
jgi:hypothetical protein